jgi:hypothetical protein
MVAPNSCLVASLVHFLLSSSSISQKSDVLKSLGPFDIRKVPESPMKGDDIEIPGINGKHVHVLIKL